MILPTAEEYFKEKYTAGEIERGDINYPETMHEYAVIVARYYVEIALEAATNNMVNQAFRLGIHKQIVESLEMAVETSYDLDNII